MGRRSEISGWKKRQKCAFKEDKFQTTVVESESKDEHNSFSILIELCQGIFSLFPIGKKGLLQYLISNKYVKDYSDTFRYASAVIYVKSFTIVPSFFDYSELMWYARRPDTRETSIKSRRKSIEVSVKTVHYDSSDWWPYSGANPSLICSRVLWMANLTITHAFNQIKLMNIYKDTLYFTEDIRHEIIHNSVKRKFKRQIPNSASSSLLVHDITFPSRRILFSWKMVLIKYIPNTIRAILNHSPV